MRENTFAASYATCSLCGAWRGAWGLEPSVEMWVAHTVEVMQAVKRVLKPSGTCWVEVGDSYAGSGSPGGDFRNGKGGDDYLRPYEHGGLGLKPKDLCLVPERLALALQQAGWWVRSRIVWAKPNPMPESCGDRPTKSHSTIWMLTKAADYYFDQEAVREPHTEVSLRRELYEHRRQGTPAQKSQEYGMPANVVKLNPAGRNVRDVWTIPTSPFGYELCQSCGQIYTAAQFGRLPNNSKSPWYENDSWERKEPWYERVCRCGASDFLSHFATFPEALPTRCILASTSEAGCCPKCGRPWERQIQKSQGHGNALPTGKAVRQEPQDNARRLWERTRAARAAGEDHDTPFGSGKTLGWAPTCKCDLSQAENVPATVLDVCSGSGTTVLAAKKLGRRAIGIDLSEKYLALARRRLEAVPLSLGGIT